MASDDRKSQEERIYLIVSMCRKAALKKVPTKGGTTCSADGGRDLSLFNKLVRAITLKLSANVETFGERRKRDILFTHLKAFSLKSNISYQ
jgi:hypothetical protein